MATADAPPVFADVSPSLFTSTILFNIQQAAVLAMKQLKMYFCGIWEFELRI